MNADLATTRIEEAVSPAEHELWRGARLQKDTQSRERLFFNYQRFAREIARRHYLDRRSGDIEYYDLCQLAYAGLLEAIDRFDPDRGAPFRSYAAQRISGSIRDGVSKASEMREQISHRNRVRRERVKSLSVEDAEDAEDADFGKALEALTELAVGLALGFMLEETSLYLDDDRDKQPNAYESLAWKQLGQRLLREVERLPDREGSVVRKHYFQDMSFSSIAELLGVTKGRVSQIHRAAMQRLNHRLSDLRDSIRKP